MGFRNAGKYRTKVSFFRDSTTLNEFREPSGTRTLVVTAFAAAETNLFNERSRHELVIDKVEVVISLRSSATIQSILDTDICVIDGVDYNIQAISYTNFSDDEIQFKISREV